MISSEGIDDDQNDRGRMFTEIRPGRRFRCSSARHDDEELCPETYDHPPASNLHSVLEAHRRQSSRGLSCETGMVKPVSAT